MFEIARYFVDHPKATTYKGYTKIAINKIGEKTKVVLQSPYSGVITVTLPKPEGW